MKVYLQQIRKENILMIQNPVLINAYSWYGFIFSFHLLSVISLTSLVWWQWYLKRMGNTENKQFPRLCLVKEILLICMSTSAMQPVKMPVRVLAKERMGHQLSIRDTFKASNSSLNLILTTLVAGVESCR